MPFYHAEVEAGVVRHEHVTVREGDKVGQLLRPAERIRHLLGVDAVDADVPLVERVVAQRRSDEPADLVHDDTVAHLHQPH